MDSHSQRAKELFQQGYNCPQAVIGAFCEDFGLDMETALKLSSPFGGGMGQLREVCGAVSGMFMVAGLKYGYTDPKDGKAKKELYLLIQNLPKQFQDKNGSIVCRELLGLDKGPNGSVSQKSMDPQERRRFCGELVACAAEIIEETMKTEAAWRKNHESNGPG